MKPMFFLFFLFSEKLLKNESIILQLAFELIFFSPKGSMMFIPVVKYYVEFGRVKMD